MFKLKHLVVHSNSIYWIFSIFIIFNSCVNSEEENALIQFVDPNIGTAHCRWFHYTPGAVPFGMAKLAPTTDAHLGNLSGWQAVGYDCRHTSIEGFANFHEFQIGGVVLAPSVGELRTVPGELDDPDSGYRSKFRKETEKALPGYYEVKLDDYQVKVELTATKRVGFHRYTYPKSNNSNLIFDIGNKQGESGEVVDAHVSYKGNGIIEGYVISSPVYVNIYQPGANIKMYFSAIVDKEPVKIGTFNKEKISYGNLESKGPGAGLFLIFSTEEDESIEIKIGLSYTSVRNARNNLEIEAKTLGFDKAKTKAFDEWEKYLGRIVVSGGKNSDKVKFYTGLYHALLGRGLASDVNGAYPKNDGSIGQIELNDKGNPIYNHYNTDAVWGAFWNLTQLWTIAYPEYFSDWIKSQLLVYKDSGWLGDGIACSKYVSGVGTNFTGLVIAAAYNCGIRDFDVKLAFEAALKNEIESKDRKLGAGKIDVGEFINRGFSPYEEDFVSDTEVNGSKFGASHTLEYSFSSYAVAQFARHLEQMNEYDFLIKLSENWKNLFDRETLLIRPKNTAGEFIKNFDPFQPWRGFQEGNAVQYTFYVPHHIDQLINLLGEDAFNQRLDSIFLNSEQNQFGGGSEIDAFSGISEGYNHGNQPSLQMPWLFNFSGRPDLSQKWVNSILDQFYGNECIHGYGYGQDEDQGQLGGWYVMSSMGLFDVKGLTEFENPAFQIGSPKFEKIVISLNNDYYSGKEFIISCDKDSIEDIYIRSVSLNGEDRQDLSLSLEEISKGGKLDIKLSKNTGLK